MPTAIGLHQRVLRGRYQIEGDLGAGGSAHVYLGFDAELARHVAIKVLHPGLARDEQFLRTFRAEARAAAALNHPNIVQIYDSGNDAGEPFLVLEYLPGGSLRDLLDQEGALAAAEIVEIAAQTARGLEYAHRRGLVHCDVKPGNLLFDDGGVVHVTDFGIARALADAAWTEPVGVALGTAKYASPEQVLRGEVGPRSDVYSLAIVCYEALVGRAPFSGDTPRATRLARVNNALPPSPRLGRLAPVLAAATASDPRTRLDASEFAAALETLAAELPTARVPKVRRPGESEHDVATAARADVDGSDITRAGTGTVAAVPTSHPVRVGGAARRRRLVRLVAVAVAVSLLLAAGAAGYIRFGLYGHDVPQLAGRQTSSAEHLARAAGLRVGVVRPAFSPSVPVGAVISQSLRPGAHVRGGSPIDLVVSKGHAPVTVPSVVGATISDATAALSGVGLLVRSSQVYSETVAPGTVVRESPAGGPAPYRSSVEVQVSMGPHPRTIPDLSGMTWPSANANLTSLRLVATESRAYSNDVPEGEVISSKPASGTKNVAVGSTVTVTVSLGPRLVAVPAVAGQPISDAIAALEVSHLDVTEQVGPPFATTASTTDPAPGQMVRPGTSVTLYVS